MCRQRFDRLHCFWFHNSIIVRCYCSRREKCICICAGSGQTDVHLSRSEGWLYFRASALIQLIYTVNWQLSPGFCARHLTVDPSIDNQTSTETTGSRSTSQSLLIGVAFPRVLFALRWRLVWYTVPPLLEWFLSGNYPLLQSGKTNKWWFPGNSLHICTPSFTFSLLCSYTHTHSNNAAFRRCCLVLKD